MSTLKSKFGQILARSGHLCTTCCSGCTGPNCVNFASIFPYQTVHGGPECSRQVIYSTTLSNPLESSANLVVTIESVFDDDLEVDGVSVGGACAAVITVPVGTLLATAIPPGGTIQLDLIDNYGVRAYGRGCACWREVLTTFSASASASARRAFMTGPSESGIAEESKRRFTICKACADTLQDGCACRLVRGCCFGRKRSDVNFHCPAGKW